MCIGFLLEWDYPHCRILVPSFLHLWKMPGIVHMNDFQLSRNSVYLWVLSYLNAYFGKTGGHHIILVSEYKTLVTVCSVVFQNIIH